MSDHPEPWAVEAIGLTKHYAGSVVALDHVDLTVRRGETVAITGPSGCGKSTLLNLIADIDTPTSGKVIVGGQDLASIRHVNRYRRDKVGLVFQFHNLLPQLPVTANVEIAMFGTHRSRHERRYMAYELLAAVDLEGREQRLPTELSGGERQRVAIARALANEPELLLADEPTGSLDSASSRRVLDLFQRLGREGMTMVIVTHSASVAAVSDRVVQMRDGRVVDHADDGGSASQGMEQALADTTRPAVHSPTP